MSWVQLIKRLGERLQQPWFGGGIGALLAVLLGLVFLEYPMGAGLRDWSYDLPFLARSEQAHTNVVVIYLDEDSLRDLKQSPADFDRNLHAQLVRRLKADGAAMIVFDMLFIDPKRSNNDADGQFARAMREHGRVILGAQVQVDNGNTTVIGPVEPLRSACAAWALAWIHREPDFGARRIHPGTERYPTLGWQAAELYGARVTKEPDSRPRERWLNYYSHEPFEGMSYKDALQPNPPISLKGKAVFVGAGDVGGYAGESKEQFRNPWTWLTKHYHLGVEIHALTFTNLLHGDWLTRPSEFVEILIIVFTGLFLGYGLSLFRPLMATAVAVSFALVITVIAYLLFVQCNLWFSWLIPVVVQAPLALFWAYLFHSVKTYTETKMLETSLALYLSPHQVKQLLKNPAFLKPGAKLETVSILFSDIASFSKISQRMDPNDLVKLLNNYYETAIGCVYQTEGTIMNLIGDAIFAIWNAPQPQADHQERACRAALLLNEHLFRFEAANTNLPMRTRIGLHTGTVCVGNIGSSTHFDYTAIGDAVNMASRLEGLNKQLGTSILATREIQKVLEGGIVTRLVGHFKFKGFDSVVEVYELISTSEKAEVSRAWRETFSKGMWNFQRKLFAEAEQDFKQTLALRPDDGPAGYYLQKIAEFKIHSPSQEWMGEIDLHDK